MKQNIHPKWYPEAKITCIGCGTVWTVGSTRPTLQVDVCSNCHPFYTGEQRIVDTEGRVDRFMKRLETRTVRAKEMAAKTVGSPEFLLSELGLGKQYTELLAANGLVTVADFIKRLEEAGDEGVLAIRGVGRKLLTDIKKKLRQKGYELPAAQD
ncbi:MAG: 50S ribosomal protein L31 [Candidatus Thermofonsia Clade 1 bacterium]|jgi:large subunit ribosomal protein L31|uniref:Large ribosomal subunit protein bL31 n=1 Tax=Candidatus Thermofonsia Clade 1 bacterium TaxID=2364210 RepID=A0A2M8PZQ8_9CHLR|nr:MAG: 50S ribosomal protein L31 [Candidatus Thermofonsia Clade 1 bacterium]PJF43032.1 MAG: 50S ribosomal protein L31 [Candidatus Thermofonsia Clade 1 bacterium]RMF48936.1 MAG: 50S ribosomal protein L31 [Chloroflexota bacterium]